MLRTHSTVLPRHIQDPSDLSFRAGDIKDNATGTNDDWPTSCLASTGDAQEWWLSDYVDRLV